MKGQTILALTELSQLMSILWGHIERPDNECPFSWKDFLKWVICMLSVCTCHVLTVCVHANCPLHLLIVDCHFNTECGATSWGWAGGAVERADESVLYSVYNSRWLALKLVVRETQEMWYKVKKGIFSGNFCQTKSEINLQAFLVDLIGQFG